MLPILFDCQVSNKTTPGKGIPLIFPTPFRVLGPMFMKNRPAYDIKKIMMVYNISQTLLSLHIWFVAASFYFTGKYSLICQPVDYSESKVYILISQLVSNKILFRTALLHCICHGFSSSPRSLTSLTPYSLS